MVSVTNVRLRGRAKFVRPFVKKEKKGRGGRMRSGKSMSSERTKPVFVAVGRAERGEKEKEGGGKKKQQFRE